MTCIRLEQISKRFGDTVALEATDLTISSGELFFLLGPSGCGKSTLLRLIAGLHDPDAGRIWFSDANGNPTDPPNNDVVYTAPYDGGPNPDEGTVNEIENPNPAPGTNIAPRPEQRTS